ncbi:MAG: hypothetical protein LBL69_06225 [Zoogloeaceae bacterium]|jgi:hypothetical protein|nr:hypothetical protein [Zoogloeaceae bacterium]
MQRSAFSWAAICAAGVLLAGCATRIVDPQAELAQVEVLAKQCIEAAEAAPHSMPGVCARLDRRFGDSQVPEVHVKVMHALSVAAGATIGAPQPSADQLAEQRARLDAFICRWRDSTLEGASFTVNQAAIALSVLTGEPQPISLSCGNEAAWQPAEDLFFASIERMAENDVKGSFELIDTLTQRFGNSPLEKARLYVAKGLFNRGAVLVGQGEWTQAAAVYGEIGQRFGQDDFPGMGEVLARAAFAQADAQAESGDKTAAIAAYEAMGRRFAGSLQYEARLWAAKGLANAAVLMAQQPAADSGAILARYDEIVSRFADDPDGDVQLVAASAQRDKYLQLLAEGKTLQAFAAADEMGRRFGQPRNEPGYSKMLPMTLTVLLDKALRQGEAGDPDSQLAGCRAIVERWGEVVPEPVRLKVEEAFSCQSEVLQAQGKVEEALAVLDQGIAHFERCCGSLAQRRTAIYLLGNKAALLSDFARPADPAGALAVLDEAQKLCEKTLSKLDDNAPEGPSLRTACLQARGNSVEPLIVLGQWDEAARRADEVRAQSTQEDHLPVIMPFLHWLAKPTASALATARKAVVDAPAELDYRSWRFNAMRRYAEGFAAPRKSRARCFFDFFEKHSDKTVFQTCLKQTR